MRVLIIFAHPEPRSFNGALRDVATATLQELGHEVEVSDLYALGFDPLEAPRHFAKRRDPDRFNAQAEQRHAWEQGTTSTDVGAEIDKLDRANLVLFQYPVWWFSMPAILKGWLDRVFTYGGLYTGRMRFDRGRFRNKQAMLSVTSGSEPYSTSWPSMRPSPSVSATFRSVPSLSSAMSERPSSSESWM